MSAHSGLGRPPRYLTIAWDAVRTRAGITRSQAWERQQRITAELMERGYTAKQIYQSRLDNPYMSDEAREILLNEIRRRGATTPGRKERKP